MNTIQDIYDAINPLPAMLSAKGRVKPVVNLQIEANAHITLHVNWVKPGSHHDWERHYECFMADTAEETIAEGIAFINDLPNAKTAKLHEFMGELGKVIDSGRDLGVDVDFLNPLTDTMKRLSENIITYRHSERAQWPE
jgi:hypothetical protein